MASFGHEALDFSTGMITPETMAGRRPSKLQHSTFHSQPTSTRQECAPAASCGPSTHSQTGKCTAESCCILWVLPKRTAQQQLASRAVCPHQPQTFSSHKAQEASSSLIARLPVSGTLLAVHHNEQIALSTAVSATCQSMQAS